MHKQAAAGLGHIQVVLEEALDGEQGLLIQAFNAALLEHLAQEHLAHGGGQLVDQTSNAQIIVADDLLFGIEHLAHFHGLKEVARSFTLAIGVPMPTTALM